MGKQRVGREGEERKGGRNKERGKREKKESKEVKGERRVVKRKESQWKLWVRKEKSKCGGR